MTFKRWSCGSGETAAGIWSSHPAVTALGVRGSGPRVRRRLLLICAPSLAAGPPPCPRRSCPRRDRVHRALRLIDGTRIRYIDAGHGAPSSSCTASAPRCTVAQNLAALPRRLSRDRVRQPRLCLSDKPPAPTATPLMPPGDRLMDSLRVRMPCSSGTPWAAQSPPRSRSSIHHGCAGSC